MGLAVTRLFLNVPGNSLLDVTQFTVLPRVTCIFTMLTKDHPGYNYKYIKGKGLSTRFTSYITKPISGGCLASKASDENQSDDILTCIYLLLH